MSISSVRFDGGRTVRGYRRAGGRGQTRHRRGGAYARSPPCRRVRRIRPPAGNAAPSPRRPRERRRSRGKRVRTATNPFRASPEADQSRRVNRRSITDTARARAGRRGSESIIGVRFRAFGVENCRSSARELARISITLKPIGEVAGAGPDGTETDGAVGPVRRPLSPAACSTRAPAFSAILTSCYAWRSWKSSATIG